MGGLKTSDKCSRVMEINLAKKERITESNRGKYIPNHGLLGSQNYSLHTCI